MKNRPTSSAEKKTKARASGALPTRTSSKPRLASPHCQEPNEGLWKSGSESLAISSLGVVLDRLADSHPPLSGTEERNLMRSDLPEEAKRYALWAHNLRFAKYVSTEAYLRKHHAVVITPSEVAGAAVEALWRSAQNFDWNLGATFINYARWHVKRAISDALREAASGISLPAQFLAKLSEARRSEKQSDEGVCALFSGMLHFDAPIGEGSASLHDLMADADARVGGESVDTAEHLDGLLSSLDKYNKKTSVVLRCYYGIGTARLSGEELAAKFGVSRQAVNSMLKKGLRRLRSTVLARGLKIDDLISRK